MEGEKNAFFYKSLRIHVYSQPFLICKNQNNEYDSVILYGRYALNKEITTYTCKLCPRCGKQKQNKTKKVQLQDWALVHKRL